MDRTPNFTLWNFPLLSMGRTPNFTSVWNFDLLANALSEAARFAAELAVVLVTGVMPA